MDAAEAEAVAAGRMEGEGAFWLGVVEEGEGGREGGRAKVRGGCTLDLEKGINAAGEIWKKVYVPECLESKRGGVFSVVDGLARS